MQENPPLEHTSNTKYGIPKNGIIWEHVCLGQDSIWEIIHLGQIRFGNTHLEKYPTARKNKCKKVI